MFLDYLANKIEKLQNQSRAVRIQILWVSVTISMIVIFSLWITGFKNNMASLITNTGEEVEKIEMPSLTSSLKETFKNTIDSFKGEEIFEELEIEETEKVEEDELKNDVKPTKLPSSY